MNFFFHLKFSFLLAEFSIKSSYSFFFFQSLLPIAFLKGKQGRSSGLSGERALTLSGLINRIICSYYSKSVGGLPERLLFNGRKAKSAAPATSNPLNEISTKI